MLVFWQLRGFLIAEPRLEIGRQQPTVGDKTRQLYREVLILMDRRLRCSVRVTFAIARNFAEPSTDANHLSIHHWRSRCIALRRVWRRGEAQEFRRPLRRRPFGGDGHDWIDDYDGGEIIRGRGGAVDDFRRARSLLVCSRRDPADDEIQVGCRSGSDLSPRSVDDLCVGHLVRVVAINGNENSLRHFGLESDEMV